VELSPHVRALAVRQVDGDEDRVAAAGRGAASVLWVRRPRGESIEAALATLELPPGEGFAWIAAETGMARRLCRHLIDDRDLDSSAIKASACWSAGVIGRHEVIGD
jgi:NADPH-dependent ferric siderophore reductase